MYKIFSFIGIALLILAIALPLMQIIPAGVAVGIAVPGVTVTLLGWLFGRTSIPVKAEAEVVQTIFSADKNFRATIKLRKDGQYQVEYWERVYNHTEHGLEPQYILQGGSTITDSLASAVDLAAERLHASH